MWGQTRWSPQNTSSHSWFQTQPPLAPDAHVEVAVSLGLWALDAPVSI